MVARFIEGGYGVSEMEEDAQGDWVRYEDYAALKADRDYWYEKCLDAGLLDEKTDEERAADRKEQDELLDEWYRTEECPYDKR